MVYGLAVFNHTEATAKPPRVIVRIAASTSEKSADEGDRF
jgi:hypothetical protein